MLAKDVPMDHGTDDSCALLWNSKPGRWKVEGESGLKT
jgi:hypothetical protein